MTSTPVRIAAFGGALVLAFGAAYAVGATATPYERGSEMHADGMEDMAMDPNAMTTAALPGLAVTQDGYTFVPADPVLASGAAVPFRFTITGPDGEPLTAYEPTHTKELHLIVVRRDLTGFQHVHPTRDDAGTWSVPLDLRDGGTYRAYADFKPAEREDGLTLGVDLQVPGGFTPEALPAPVASTTVDGYDVTLRGTAEAGADSTLTFTVTRDGRPVALAPYLGAFGHLVSLRAGDLAYLHTHPEHDAEPGETGGPEVTFMTEFPTAGSYRLFLDFSAGGAVHTAAFTLAVGSDGQAPKPTPAASAPHRSPAGHGTDHTH